MAPTQDAPDRAAIQRCAGAGSAAQNGRGIERPIAIQVAIAVRTAEALRSNRYGLPTRHRSWRWQSIGIELLDQDALTAIVDPGAVLREHDVAEVPGLSAEIDRNLCGSGGGPALAVGNGGGDAYLLGLRAAAVA